MNLQSQWTVYRTRFLVRARQLTEPLIFTDPFGREQSGQPGDYLVESSDGLERIASQALFEDIYVPLAATPLRLAAASFQTEGTSGVLVRPVARASPDRSPATA